LPTIPVAGDAELFIEHGPSISHRAYEAADHARDALMQSAIAHGIEAAFEARVEAMRSELKAHLGLDRTEAELVFSAGTGSQLQALCLTRVLIGAPLTTIIVAADQTGSGTAHTALGHHFGEITANGSRVRKGEPIGGLGSARSTAPRTSASFSACGRMSPFSSRNESGMLETDGSVAALRICIGARDITESWSDDTDTHTRKSMECSIASLWSLQR
jgi:hypothetical protein